MSLGTMPSGTTHPWAILARSYLDKNTRKLSLLVHLFWSKFTGARPERSATIAKSTGEVLGKGDEGGGESVKLVSRVEIFMFHHAFLYKGCYHKFC